MRSAISTPTKDSLPYVKVAGAKAAPADDASAGDVAAYLYDLLVGAHRLAVLRKHRFLAYLIGMAVEEARLQTLGRSAALGERE